MRAIAVRDWGGRDKLELIEHDVPPVAPDGVLVRIKAAGVNPVDAKIRGGAHTALKLSKRPRLGRAAQLRRPRPAGDEAFAWGGERPLFRSRGVN